MNEKLSKLLIGVSHLYPHKTDEQFPHIAEKIANLWGTVGMPRYFNELLFNDRGSRQGFPSEIMAEIFAISNYYDSHQVSEPSPDGAWLDAAELDRLERYKTKS
ncbi:MAG: hypothetical protein ABI831_28125 [Betaproteobacteria bacterium]